MTQYARQLVQLVCGHSKAAYVLGTFSRDIKQTYTSNYNSHHGICKKRNIIIAWA